MKLFQIEEPEGGPFDSAAPGAAIGIDASRSDAVVAFAIGGNAVILDDRAGFELVLTVPGAAADGPQWRNFFERARLRAERALARPVTHAVVVLDVAGDDAAQLTEAAAGAGVAILRLVLSGDMSGAEEPAFAAAILAEDLVPRPENPTFG